MTTEQINANRVKAGLPPLQTSPALPQQSATKQMPQVDMQALLSVMQTTPSQQASAKKKGVLEQVGEKRGAEVVRSLEARKRGEQGLIRTIGQIEGQVLGGASDIIGAGVMGALKTITPKPIEHAVQKGSERAISSFFQTRPGQAIGREMNKLEKDTVGTRDIKSLLGVSSFGLDVSGLGLGAKAVQKTAQTATKQIAEQQLKQLPKQIVKTQGKTLKLYEKAIDVAPRVKQSFEQRFNETLPSYLNKQQIPINVKANNQLDVTPSIEKLDDILDIEETSLQQVLATKKRTEDVFDIRDTAKQAIAETAGEVDGAQIAKNINQFILSKKQKVYDAEAFNAFKRKFNKYYDKSDAAKNEAARAIQRVMRQQLLNKYPEDDILKQTLQRMSQAIEAKTVMQKIGDAGLVLRGGKLGRQINQLIGAAALSKVPILGPWLGYELGGRITDYMLNPQRLTTKAIKELQKIGIVPDTLKRRKEVLEFLTKDLEKKLRGSRELPMLPAATKDSPRVPTQPVIVPPFRPPTQFETRANIVGQ